MTSENGPEHMIPIDFVFLLTAAEKQEVVTGCDR